MKKLRYFDNQIVQKGDKFVAPRWGTCVVKGFDRINKCAVAKNVLTEETFDMLGRDTFSESDLCQRKAKQKT